MYRGVKCHFKVTSDLEITTNHPIDITVYGQKVTIDGTKTFSIK
jgi:hypothetical protein